MSKETVSLSSLDVKINLLYRLQIASEILSQNIDVELAAEKKHLQHEVKAGIGEYQKKIKFATEAFFRRVEPHILAAVGRTGDWRNYDLQTQYANELLSLMFRFEEKTAESEENFESVMNHIKGLAGGMGLFPEEKIVEDFGMKAK